MPIHGYPGNVITANPTAPTSSVATGVWTTEQQLAAVAAGNWPFTIPPQQISRSLRFNSADSANLTRTPTTTGSRRIYTHSAWFKRTGLSSAGFNVLWASESSGTNYVGFVYYQDKFYWNFYNGTTSYVVETTQVFRDVSAWSHIVVAVDTTQATASNRVRIYHNGVQITVFNTSNYPPQDQDLPINTSSFVNKIGFSAGFGQYLNGYMAELNFLDGYPTVNGTTYNATTWAALNVSTLFGETDTNTGVWKPKEYAGSYGTNGFYVNFSDNSNTTAATLGKDYSGNGNNLTPSGFSVTAGVGNDSLVDSPTSYGTDTGVGGEVRGNYATLNPLKRFTANATLSNGNLTVSDGSTTSTSTIATMSLPASGKWYWEITVSASVSGGIFIGACPETNAYGTAVVQTNGSYRNNGTIYNTASATQTSGATYTTNDVIGVAVDVDNGTVQFYKNGTAQGATPSFSFTALTVLVPFIATDNAAGTKTVNCNFGQRAFEKWNGSAYVANTAPSGFKALCTQNLPTPTIGATSTTQANDYFDVTTYTGNGGTQSIVNSGAMQPGLVWIKGRSVAYDHQLTDSVRGVGKELQTNATNSEQNYGLVSALNSNGFTVFTNGTYLASNQNGTTYVGWQWKANGAGSTNTAGTITSTVSANTTSGFSIVQWTGSGANGTVGHGLGVAPQFMFMKNKTNSGTGWPSYHAFIDASAPQNYYISLADTAGRVSASNAWNNTAPTSSVFSVGSSSFSNGGTMIAYVFAPVAGYSAFGSYTGNGSADGPFVYTGFRPRYVLTKEISASGQEWFIWDSARDTYNQMQNEIFPNSSAAENSTGWTYQPYIDFTSNGFKLRSINTHINGSGSTLIYAAFAEHPFKYSLAR